MRFIDQEFVTCPPISNIKYNHPRLQNNNCFYLFHNQLDYRIANHFAKSKTTKSNIDKFLSKLLIDLFTEKLSYQNVDK